MTLFSALNGATQGLRYFQSSVQVLSENIAQANDPNRSRATISASTLGTGEVRVASYGRVTSGALQEQLNEVVSQRGAADVRNDFLSRVNDLFGSSNNKPGIQDVLDKFQTAWQGLATSPESDLAQRNVITTGDSLAREIRRLAAGVEELDGELGDNITDVVNRINQALKDIDTANTTLGQIKVQNLPTNAVEDRRDAAIRTLNDLIGVKTAVRADGKIAVFTNTGLALVDNNAVTLGTDGKTVTVLGGTNITLDPRQLTGRIGALLQMRSDGSQATPPVAASADPASEIIRKLRDQLDQFVQMFTQPTPAGQPTSFADAYNNATPSVNGELVSGFFNGTNRFSIAVNQLLQSAVPAQTAPIAVPGNPVMTIKASALQAVTASFLSANRTFTATGLTITGGTYSDVANGIAAQWTNTQKTWKDQFKLQDDNQKTFETRFKGEVGVNIDEEVALLQQLQTSYNASARVISTIDEMFAALERTLG